MEIAVIAHNRPRYLYVTLFALFKAKGIKNYPVRVYIDGNNMEERASHGREKNAGKAFIFGTSAFKSAFNVGVKNVALMFPTDDVIQQPKNIGNLKNLMYGLKDCFERKANKVMYLEDDFIIRTDTLEYAENTTNEHCFLSLSGGRVYSSDDYRPIGNVIEREKFVPLCQWVEKGSYIGRPRPGHEVQLLDKNTTGHDGVFYRYLVDHNLKTLFSDKFYVAHFGLRGMNYPNLDNDANDLENQMFRGNEKQWLSNILDIIENHKYPNKFKLRFWPQQFRYE